MNKVSSKLSLGTFILISTLVFGCSSTKDSVTIIPGPIVDLEQQPTLPSGSSGVGTTPISSSNPNPSPLQSIATPQPIPVIPVPGSPLSILTVTPATITFAAGDLANKTFTVAPAAAPIGGNLILNLTITQLTGTGTVTIAPTQLTFVQGSAVPQTVTVSRPANIAGTVRITITRDNATTATNFGLGTPVPQFVDVILQAP